MAKSLTKPDPEADPANVDAEELATNQEATVIPFVAGEVRVAARWVSPVYGLTPKERPSDIPGKK